LTIYATSQTKKEFGHDLVSLSTPKWLKINGMNPVFYEKKDCIGEANATGIHTNNQKHTPCNPAEAIHNDNFGLKCGIGERKSKINISEKINE
jgi:hypothetical protein